MFQRNALAVPLAAVMLGSAACVSPVIDEVEIPAELTDSVWELQQIQFNDGQLLQPSDPQNYTIDFTEDGEVFIQADCNQVRGDFTVEADQRLMITPGASTRVACPEGAIDTEFVQALESSAIYFFQDGNLFIDLAFDSGTMQFAAVPQSALIETTWELQQIQFNDGKLLQANLPENYTVEFSAAGEVFVQADCNRAIGQFTEAGDGSITIELGPTTLAACPEGSIGTDFIQALNNSAIYFFQDGNLFIDLKFDSGTMQLAEASQSALVGTTWDLQQIQFNDGTLLVAEPPQNYRVEFAEGGEVFVQADCNRAIGQFTAASNGGISIELGPTTLAACPEGSIGPDFIQALNNSAIYFFQDGNLFIDLKFDSGTMQLAEAADVALAGTSWQLQQIQFNDGALLTPEAPENYTVEFAEGGEVFVQADCNRAIGQFTEGSDRRLGVEVGATTLAACPEGSLGNDFVQALNNSTLYFFQDGNLFIDLKFDSGTMALTPLD